MSRKLILTMAMSLDGFIADEDGGYAWLNACSGVTSTPIVAKFDFSTFLSHVDTVVMGRRCYDEGMAKDFTAQTILVATTRPTADHDHVRFIGGDIVATITDLMQQPGKDIFLFGGGIVAEPFISANLIDEYIIGIAPVILGKGRPFFVNIREQVNLTARDCYFDNGTAILHYTKQ